MGGAEIYSGDGELSGLTYRNIPKIDEKYPCVLMHDATGIGGIHERKLPEWRGALRVRAASLLAGCASQIRGHSRSKKEYRNPPQT